MPELLAVLDAFTQEHRRCLTYYNGTQMSGETDEEAEEREARRRETVYSGRDLRQSQFCSSNGARCRPSS